MNIVEVHFDYNNASSFFKNYKFDLKKNLTVIVNTERGLQFGKVVRIVDDVSSFNDVTLYEVVRIASKKDYFHYLDNLKMGKEAVLKCKELVTKDGLDMIILDGYYNFERTQLLFRFVADMRIDFRSLARELGSLFHTRIELRQVGIRDKAKEIGGFGPCGRLLCCTSFLKGFDSVTISMAKNQSVSLNPTKINGVCGRLLCCLKYENDSYNEMKSVMPKVGEEVSIKNKKGRVVQVNLLKENYVVQLEDKSKVVVDLNEM